VRKGGFNPTLVRLRPSGVTAISERSVVSIPRWFD